MAHDLRADRSTPDPEWVALDDAAARLGVSVDTVREWIALGRLTARQAGPSDGDLVVMLEPAAKVQALRPAPHSIVQGFPPDSGIVGRGQELDALTGALDATSGGTGTLVLIGGEAGIGKTTLVNAIIPRAESRSFAVLTGHCFDVEHTPPYGPWTEMFRDLALAEVHPAVPPTFLEHDALQNVASPTALYATVEQFLLDAASCRPLLVVLEDQHWADQASLELLRYLARRLLHEPIMFVITYRDVELSPEQPLFRFLPHLIREAHALRLAVRRLDRDAVDDIVRTRYTLTDRDAQRLSAYLWRYAEGNPFFTEELANSLEDEGTLASAGDRWQLGELHEFRVPPIVRQVIENRLWHLSRADRDILEVAAAIGVEAPVELWLAAAGVSEQQLSDCINQALKGQLIEEFPERSSVRFRHALIQEALYDGLTILSRRARHQRIAEILADEPQADPEIVAHHFNQARDFRAVEWLIQSGRRAALGFAYHEAVKRFEQAREFLELRPEHQSTFAWLLCELAVAYRYLDPRRALSIVERAWEHASNIEDRALQAVLLRTRSHIRGFLGDNGLPELYEAVEVYEALSDHDRERIDQTALAYTVNRGTLAQRIAYYARYEDARAIGEQFIAAAATPVSARQHNEHGIAWLGLGLAYANLGQPDAARGAFASARDHLQRVSNHFLLGQTYSHEYRHVIQTYFPERVETRRRLIDDADTHFEQSIFAQMSNHGKFERIYTALILDGRWDETRESADELVKTEYMRVECSEVLAEIDWYQGNTEQVWSWIERAIPAGSSAEPASVYYHEILGLQYTAALAALAAGQPEHALVWIEAHERWRNWGDLVIGKHSPHLLRARYHQVRGELDLALERARAAVACSLQPRQPLSLLRSERLLGTLAGEAGLHVEAERHLGVAMDLARSIQAPYETALTETEYAQLLVATNKAVEARPLLQTARGTLEALDAKPALERLAAVETRTAEATGQPAEAVAGLSPREVEVLQLVAQGMTDAEIGEQLFISRRTVSGHLQSIFNKCGVSSRAAATAFAYENGIVAGSG